MLCLLSVEPELNAEKGKVNASLQELYENVTFKNMPMLPIREESFVEHHARKEGKNLSPAVVKWRLHVDLMPCQKGVV